MTRSQLPERRSHEVIRAVHEPAPGVRAGITIGIGRYDDGRLGEVFFDPDQVAHAPMMRDAAVLTSLALQSGATITDLAGAITRTEDGRTPSTMIGAAIDAVAREVQS
jgi:hypothetical protein